MRCLRRKKVEYDESDEALLKKSEEVSPASFFQLFRYAKCSDFFLLFVGFVVAVATGIGSPLLSVLIGDISQNFIDVETRLGNNTSDDSSEIYDKFSNDVIETCLKYACLGAIVLVVSTLEVLCFMIVSENMANRLRREFLASVLRQNVAWFDSKPSGSFATKLFDNLERVKEGTGEKMGHMVQYLAQFVGGFAIALFRDWWLTLIMMSLVPLLALCGFFLSKLITDEEKEGTENYSKAGAVAEQAITSIRTVIAFNGQDFECKRYEKALAKGRQAGLRKASIMGIILAITFLVLFGSYCLAFWTGTNLVYEGSIEGGTVMTVFFAVMMGSMALGSAGPLFGAINTARMAAGMLYAVIDRIPEIDASSTEGLKPENLNGSISIKNIKFAYPSRPEIQVLKGLSLEAKSGQTVALVGASGCGKSSLIQLLLRYYDPLSGSISIDGIETNKLNIEYLRNFIGVVSQEPVLFNTTIEQNIRFGRQDVTLGEIEEALRKANAFQFVKSFPHGLQTTVGDRGTQLSGGQKQRLAIARALIRDPKILLLDEATSALDTESESIVQAALENASIGRTTIVIAHRLSTVRNADVIVVMKEGQVVEVGRHSELIEKRAFYYDLVNAQIVVEEKKPITPESARPISAQFARSTSHETTPRPNFDMKRLKSQTSTVYDASERIDRKQVKESEEDVERLKKELIEEGVQRASLWSIFRFARTEWCYLVIALVCSCLGGMVFPAFSLFFAQIISVFSTPDKEEMLKDGHRYSLFFLALGAAEAVFALIKTVAFGLVSEKMTERMRALVFRNVMRMDGTYFDTPNHAPGKIVTRLATDAPNVKSAIDDRLGALFGEIVSDIFGLSIAVYFGWQMALPVFAIFLLAAMFQAMRMRYVTDQTKAAEKEMENSGKVALEAIEHIRTVQALTLQKRIHKQFCEHLDGPFETSRRKATIQGISQGISTALFYFLFAGSFRFGLYLILEGHLQPMEVLRVMFAISFTAGSLGMISAYLPDYLKATLAAGLIFKMIKEKSDIDETSEEGIRPSISGRVKFENVHFNYPQRPDIAILQGLNFEVTTGTTLALVGSSGCGKSTVIALLERLYNPSSGNILLDNVDVKSLNPMHLRDHVALVSQEPTLFDCSIKENIAYGMALGSFSDADVLEAAKKANIHQFISNLPDGYNTSVGERGTQLSGGQKQRIAIARALIRKPKVLLLDEATSALDTESEKLVQEALEKASEGRSVIVIAHRLSTITSADCIAVVSNGIVVEKGTHSQLMDKKGAYWGLHQKQNRHHR